MTEWDRAWGTPGAYFADTLGNGTVTAEPKVASQAGTKDLCYKDKGAGCSDDSFINGALEHSATNLNDGVKVTLYYAKDGHRIRYTEYITINGKNEKISAISAPFTVLPGDPARIVIEGPDGELPDSITVKQTDPEQILHAVAVDEWGNRIGDYPSNWNAGNPIPVTEVNRPVIIYVPGRATDNNCGWLVVSVPGKPTMKDSVYVARPA